MGDHERWALDLPLILWIPEQEEEEFQHRKHLAVLGGLYRGFRQQATQE